MIPKVLSIAGSDSSGGAGIQADLKTFSALGCYGMSVITALTAQNTKGVQGVYPVDAGFVALQIRSIFEDIGVQAAKIGMAGNAETIAVIADMLQEYQAPFILDPVMVAQSGDRLIDDAAVQAIKEQLVPAAALVTPNLPEAEVLLGRPVDDPLQAAEDLLQAGAQAVLLKGGHGGGETAVDVLMTENGPEIFEAPRLKTRNTHGTGCTLSAALCCFLAKNYTLAEAVGEAKAYISRAIAGADDLDVGAGAGPVHHFHDWWLKSA